MPLDRLGWAAGIDVPETVADPFAGGFATPEELAFEASLSPERRASMESAFSPLTMMLRASWDPVARAELRTSTFALAQARADEGARAQGFASASDRTRRQALDAAPGFFDPGGALWRFVSAVPAEVGAVAGETFGGAVAGAARGAAGASLGGISPLILLAGGAVVLLALK